MVGILELAKREIRSHTAKSGWKSHLERRVAKTNYGEFATIIIYPSRKLH